MTSTATKIAENFDKAALSYDNEAPVQTQVAEQLIDFATLLLPPATALDIGCGTGFVAASLACLWPRAEITAIDKSPAMLLETQRKAPRVHGIEADAANLQLDQTFEVIFSSMLLHWLPDPARAIRQWQSLLKPDGKLFVALLTEGSFQEWRDVCEAGHVRDGLWTMPAADFGQEITSRAETQTLRVIYDSAFDFLKQLKAIGAATPKARHKPFSTGTMRELLGSAPRPFPVTFKVLYLELPSPGSI
jgi:malonyl-CoA O-methyltransferase